MGNTDNPATSILDQLSRKIVGQQTAISGIASTVKTYQAGLAPIGRPAGVFLLLGPTGTGKTRTVEALAEILHGAAQKVVKINCGEFQSDHEVAKLIGSPPGYLGHRETKPVLTQDRLSEQTSPECDLSVVLFDEIEKAAPAVSKLLLGILDKATLSLGDNTEVNFEKSLIFLTSNLGAREMMRELQPELGFRPPASAETSDLPKKLETIALNAVKRMYSPEFVNRIDAVVTYQPLDSEALALILDQQITDLQSHVNNRLADKCFHIEINDEARSFLLEKGTSQEYGARELKRSIHKYLTQPLATMVIERRVQPGATVHVVVEDNRESLAFETPAYAKGAENAGPTILILDDNRDFLRLLTLELSHATNWNVITAQSAAEADPAVATGTIDFGLFDLMLPDGNGLDMAVRFRDKFPQIQIAIMTGAELSPREEQATRNFDVEIVNKPFLPQQIIDLVSKKMRKKTRLPASA